MRKKLCFCLLFKCLLVKATVIPDPYFLHLTRTYDVNNKTNLLKRKTSKGQIHVSLKKPLETKDDFWEDLTPQLNNNIASDIKRYQLESQLYTFAENDNSQIEQRDKIKSRFVRHYLEKRVVNGFLVKRIKESSATLSSVEDGVRTLSGEKVHSPAVVSSVPKEEDDLDFGSKTDWIRQRTRMWFNCPLFQSEALVRLSSFSQVNYELKMFDTISFDDKDSLFNHFTYQLLVSNEETSSLVKTNLSKNLNLNYKAVFSGTDHVVFVNYNVEW